MAAVLSRARGEDRKPEVRGQRSEDQKSEVRVRGQTDFVTNLCVFAGLCGFARN